MQQRPITITATLAVWLSNSTDTPAQLLDRIDAGQTVQAINMLQIYGGAELDKMGSWTRMGEADVTVRLLPRDQQVALAVKGLQEKLDKARAAFHAMQQETLAQIQKLQAIEFSEVVS